MSFNSLEVDLEQTIKLYLFLTNFVAISSPIPLLAPLSNIVFLFFILFS